MGWNAQKFKEKEEELEDLQDRMVSNEEVKWVKLVQEYVTLEDQLKELEERVTIKAFTDYILPFI